MWSFRRADTVAWPASIDSTKYDAPMEFPDRTIEVKT